MPGPPRTPTADLKARGSRLAKGRAADESTAAVGEPDVPAYLDDRAREEWARLVPLLLARHVLTEADGAVLGEHCQAVADVERYQEAIAEAGGEVVETPNGALQRHPYTVMLREARERLLKTAGLFGMSAADRTKATTAKGKPAGNRFSVLRGGAKDSAS